MSAGHQGGQRRHAQEPRRPHPGGEGLREVPVGDERPGAAGGVHLLADVVELGAGEEGEGAAARGRAAADVGVAVEEP